MSYEAFLQLAKSRRSIRKFLKKPIPDEAVEKIIRAASYAPSARNTQPWDFVVVQDPEVKEEVTKKLLENMPPMVPKGFVDAPVYIFLFGDTRVRPFIPGPEEGAEEHWRFNLCASMSCAFDHMFLAAASMGLGAMWVSAVRSPKVDTMLKETLGVHEDLLIFQMLAVGYSDMVAQPKKMRNFDRMVHYDRGSTGDYRSDSEIESFFNISPA